MRIADEWDRLNALIGLQINIKFRRRVASNSANCIVHLTLIKSKKQIRNAEFAVSAPKMFEMMSEASRAMLKRKKMTALSFE